MFYLLGLNFKIPIMNGCVCYVGCSRNLDNIFTNHKTKIARDRPGFSSMAQDWTGKEVSE